MVKKVLFIILSFFLISVVFADDISKWRFSRDLINTSPGYNQVLLDEHVYKNAKSNLEDIRVIDSNNTFIPYYLGTSKNNESYSIEEYDSLQLLQFQKDLNNYIDFAIINENKNKDTVVNELLLKLETTEDYLKDVNIYGSYDNTAWDYILSDKIYRTADGTKDSLKLGDTYKYDFYRVVFLNEAIDVPVEYLKALKVQKNITNIAYEKTKKISYDLNTTKDISNITINNMNLLKIKQLTINSNDTYDRYYTLSLKETKESEAVYLGGGRLYNIDLEKFSTKNNTIEFNPYVKDQFLTIEVHNEDNAPISIDSIDITYAVDRVIFEAVENESYTLLIGNALIDKPNYDIENYKEYVDAEDKQLVEMGALIKTNTSENSKESSYDLKTILNILVVIIAIILIFVIFKNYKKNI